MAKGVTIERVSGVSKADFYRYFVSTNKPVIITDVMDNWEALNKWSPVYFKTSFGGAKAGVMHLKNEQCDADTYKETDDGRALVSSVMDDVNAGLPHTKKVIASPLENFPKEIWNDFSVPHYCSNGKYLRSRIYIGPSGIVTPLHQDLPENIYTMVAGAKTITLYHPSDKKNLYPNPLFSKHPNFSQTDPELPNYLLYPRSAHAHPYIIHLVAGESLYIPSFWWHHLRNTQTSIAMSFWWTHGWKTAVAWGAATYKKLLLQ